MKSLLILITVCCLAVLSMGALGGPRELSRKVSETPQLQKVGIWLNDTFRYVTEEDVRKSREPWERHQLERRNKKPPARTR